MNDIIHDYVPFVGGLPVWLGCIVMGGMVACGVVLNRLLDNWARRRAPWMFGWRPALVMPGLSIAGVALMIALNPPWEALKAMRQLEQNRPLPKSN